MNKEILDHHLQFSVYTNPGLYRDKLQNDLPNDVREIGLLVRKNLIHRSTLQEGNVGTNADLRFGDITKVPWYRQTEDDILVTASAMLAELYRRDEKGLTMNREPKDKIVVTCRFTAILMASILKSKKIPARVRSVNVPYFDMGNLGRVSTDHWVNQYWSKEESRWIIIDVDGSLSLNEELDPYDIPEGKLDFPGNAWMDIRLGKVDQQYFYNATPAQGAIVVLWSLFYDFHSLMNDEILYTYGPACGYGIREKFEKLSEEELKRMDDLAMLMQDPDKNFYELENIWETKKDFRLLTGSLL